MVQIFIYLDMDTIKKLLKENQDKYFSVIQTIEEYNFNIGLLKCLDFKKTTGCSPVGFEMIEADDESFEFLQCQRFFFNGKVIDKNNIPKSKDWNEVFKEFSDFDKYIYINKNFCTPYIEETDKIINVNI